MAELKIYKATIHRHTGTLYGFACSTSKTKGAALLGVSPTSQYLEIEKMEPSHDYAYLKEGQVAYYDPNARNSSPILSLRDKDMLAMGDISIIDSAEKILQACDIQNKELKVTLQRIRAELTELKIDLKDDLRERYAAYTKS